MTTLTREQVDALARFDGAREIRWYGFIDRDHCVKDGLTFDPINNAEQFDRILFAYSTTTAILSGAVIDALRGRIGDKTLTDRRAAVLVAISDEVK